MHIGRQYTLVEFLYWSRYDSYWILGGAVVPTVAQPIVWFRRPDLSDP
ncbi:MAG: hypothetical protein K2Y26_15795 [Gemmatimonadaceae bacterium]|jgi:hypothetical protein|nr:hypothetical protein [Gemmatimonadaceae bacterium]